MMMIGQATFICAASILSIYLKLRDWSLLYRLKAINLPPWGLMAIYLALAGDGNGLYHETLMLWISPQNVLTGIILRFSIHLDIVSIRPFISVSSPIQVALSE